MCTAALGLILALAAIPPLAPDERTALADAFDGRDHREAAFDALVAHARTWTDTPGDTPVRLDPDFASMNLDPAAYRGDLCRLQGVLIEPVRLPPPWDDTWEWFIRDASHQLAVAYIVGLTPESAAAFAEGDEVVVYARFYKRMDRPDRTGAERRYPLFVGALPRPRKLSQSASTAIALHPAAVIIIATFILIPTLLIALAIARRSKRRTPALHRTALDDEPAEVDDPRPLPDDPADALAELKRRAEE
jgi:hypothetical protein